MDFQFRLPQNCQLDIDTFARGGKQRKFNVKCVKLVVRERQQKLYLWILKCNGTVETRDPTIQNYLFETKLLSYIAQCGPAPCVSIDVNNEQEDVNNVWTQLSPARSPLLAPFPSDMSQTLVTRQRRLHNSFVILHTTAHGHHTSPQSSTPPLTLLVVWYSTTPPLTETRQSFVSPSLGTGGLVQWTPTYLYPHMELKKT